MSCRLPSGSYRRSMSDYRQTDEQAGTVAAAKFFPLQDDCCEFVDPDPSARVVAWIEYALIGLLAIAFLVLSLADLFSA